MRLDDKHICAMIHDGLFHIDFEHSLKLESESVLPESVSELGVSIKGAQQMKQRINRT